MHQRTVQQQLTKHRNRHFKHLRRPQALITRILQTLNLLNRLSKLRQARVLIVILQHRQLRKQVTTPRHPSHNLIRQHLVKLPHLHLRLQLLVTINQRPRTR